MTSEEDSDGRADAVDNITKEDDENLDDILASMDIDSDYNAWTSFRLSSSRDLADAATDTAPCAAPTTATASVMDPDLDWAQWRKRLGRVEVYSARYKPCPTEIKELTQLAASIGLGGTKGFLGNLFGKKAATTADDNDSSDHRQRFETIREQSILLARGYAFLTSTNNNSIRSVDSNSNTNKSEVEIVLLTHGLVLAKVMGPQDSNKHKNKKMVVKNFLACISWDHLDHVQEVAEDNRAFELHLTNTVVWTLTTASYGQQVAWLDAFETVLVRTHLHKSKKSLQLGWQYTLVHRGGFTSAVTGREEEDIVQILLPNVNRCDSYNGLAPLHYAVRNGHVNIARQLLQHHKADANVKDTDGFTPMYYAVRDQRQDLQQLLCDFGADEPDSASSATAQYGCGELFGFVAEAQEAVDERRLTQQAEAEAAQVKMAENMRALEMRGEKIRDMDDKAREMNEGAANYADMARQLKEKSKPTFFGIL